MHTRMRYVALVLLCHAVTGSAQPDDASEILRVRPPPPGPELFSPVCESPGDERSRESPRLILASGLTIDASQGLLFLHAICQAPCSMADVTSRRLGIAAWSDEWHSAVLPMRPVSMDSASPDVSGNLDPEVGGCLHLRIPIAISAIQSRLSYLGWSAKARPVAERIKQGCCTFQLAVLDEAAYCVVSAQWIHVPSTGFGLSPTVYLEHALRTVQVFALDLHAAFPFAIFYKWAHRLPFHFKFMYFTDFAWNPIAHNFLPSAWAENIVVDGTSLMESGVLPWAGKSSVDNFQIRFSGDDAFRRADILFCHDPALLCRLFLGRNKPIIAVISYHLHFLPPLGAPELHGDTMLDLLTDYRKMCTSMRTVCAGTSPYAQAQGQLVAGQSIALNPVIPSVRVQFTYAPDWKKFGNVYVSLDRVGREWKRWRPFLVQVEKSCTEQGQTCKFVRNTIFSLYTHYTDYDQTLREISSFPLALFLPYAAAASVNAMSGAMIVKRNVSYVQVLLHKHEVCGALCNGHPNSDAFFNVPPRA